jgi:hypothetical protein
MLCLLLDAARKMDRFGFSVALAIREEGRGWHRLEAERPNRPRPASREKQFGTPTQANLKLTTSRWLPEMARGATKAAQRERKRVRQNSKRQLRPVARDADLVPVQELGSFRRLAQDEDFAFFTRPANSPLPPAALAFYSRGGCWNLALALHEATGLPIELYLRDGVPIHGYVVDGDSSLDGFGRRKLADTRAGSDGVRRISAKELRDDLGATVNRPEWQAKAERAARIILETTVG